MVPSYILILFLFNSVCLKKYYINIKRRCHLLLFKNGYTRKSGSGSTQSVSVTLSGPLCYVWPSIFFVLPASYHCGGWGGGYNWCNQLTFLTPLKRSNLLFFSMLHSLAPKYDTVCPRNVIHFYVSTQYTNMEKTSWTYRVPCPILNLVRE